MGALKHTPKDPYVSLFHIGALRQMPLVHATLIKPFDCSPIGSKDICFFEFDYIPQKDPFLVNCAILI
jgi:hypothetical protein